MLALLDSCFNFNKQVRIVVKCSLYYLRNTANLKTFLSHKDLETGNHDFTFSQLDYFNSLYLGLTKYLYLVDFKLAQKQETAVLGHTAYQ